MGRFMVTNLKWTLDIFEKYTLFIFQHSLPLFTSTLSNILFLLHVFSPHIYSKIPNFISSYNHPKCYNIMIITMLKDIIFIYFNEIKNKSWRQYNIANCRGARLRVKVSLLPKMISISLLSQKVGYTHTNIHANTHKHIYI